MKDSIRRLPDAEQEVMQAIWACTAPVARTDIEEILFKTHRNDDLADFAYQIK